MAEERSYTLLEKTLRRLGGSWLILGCCLLGLELLLFFIAGYLEEAPASNSPLAGMWLAPVMTLALCLLQPWLNGRFQMWVSALRPRLALTDRDFSNYLEELTLGKGRYELSALLLGAVSGFWLDQPWTQDGAWQSWLYRAPTRAIMAALIVWLVFVALNRTQCLTQIHRGPAGFSFTNREISDPVIHWSLEISATLLGLFALAGVLMVQSPIRNRYLFVGGLLLALSIVFLLNRALSFLFSSVYQSSFLFAVLLIILTAALGTLGYRLLEGWDWLDGLYMTIITMTTVGYGETHELTANGRFFTMFLMITSIGIGGYAISTVAAYVVEGDFNRVFRGRKMKKEINKLTDHIILCGAGRIGREIAGEFYQTLTPFVMIETNEEKLKLFPYLEETPHLVGDATSDEVLQRAGVEQARGLVAALSEDQANVFLVLGVRALNPRLRIIARLADDQNRKKLLRAGADEVVHTEAIGGLRMASMMIRPSVVSFLDQMLRVSGNTLRVEELGVNKELAGLSLEQVKIPERTGLLILAMKSGIAGQYQFNPMPSTTLEPGDVLIVMGDPHQLALGRGLKPLPPDQSA